MTLEIVSPEATLFKGEVTSVSLPGINGSFQVLNQHAPIVSLLQKGTVKFEGQQIKIQKQHLSHFQKINDFTYTLDINSGTIEMNQNKIIVLAD